MIVIRETALNFIETPGANASAAVATPSRGATDVSVVRQRQQPGGGNPAHSHDREEVMVVTRGSVEVALGNGSVTLYAGDSLIIPAHSSHRLANNGTTAAEWLLIAPAGVEFFHASGEQAHPAWAQ